MVARKRIVPGSDSVIEIRKRKETVSLSFQAEDKILAYTILRCANLLRR
jgi:hypothetical protein